MYILFIYCFIYSFFFIYLFIYLFMSIIYIYIYLVYIYIYTFMSNIYIYIYTFSVYVYKIWHFHPMSAYPYTYTVYFFDTNWLVSQPHVFWTTHSRRKVLPGTGAIHATPQICWWKEPQQSVSGTAMVSETGLRCKLELVHNHKKNVVVQAVSIWLHGEVPCLAWCISNLVN